MRISIIEDPAGRFGLTATPEEYDGHPPVSTLWVDARPKRLAPDRVAIAGALAFGRYVSGRLVFDSAVAPATAEAIAQFLKPAFVAVEPIDFRPRMLPKGETAVLLMDPASEVSLVGDRPHGSSRNVCFWVVRSDLWAGSLIGTGGVVTPANAWLVSPGMGLEGLRAALAVAVLFAEDFEADRVILPDNLAPDIGSTERRLFDAVRLGLLTSSAEFELT